MAGGMQQIFPTLLDDVAQPSWGPQERLGTIRWEGNKCYKYVKYSKGSANLDAVVGYAVAYLASDTTLLTVTSDNSDTAGISAGVLISVIPDLGFGWIQIKGLATLSQALESGNAGNTIYSNPAGTDGAFRNTSSATLADFGAIISTSPVVVYLDCPY